MEKSNIEKTLKREYTEIDDSINNINSLLKIILFETFGEKVEILYSIVDDNDKFSQMLKAFGGMNVNFPTVEQFKSSVTLSLVFYYKEVMHYSWKKIEQLIPHERDISLRYGSRIKNLSKSIKKHLTRKCKEKIQKTELFEEE
jgi:hypothetical protein